MSAELILESTKQGVTTLTMNMPKRLNGWTLAMMDALRGALTRAAEDPEAKALILTGMDPYYCAGVNLSSTIQLGHPKKLRALIVEHNQGLFETFIHYPKPIIVAINGPSIGASVTSATLCDAIVASERATFSTPFAALGVPPEGCSSVLFPRLVGDPSAARILGTEGWKPTAAEALEIGLVDRVVPHDELLDAAQKMAEERIQAGGERSYRAGMTRDELLAINARESQAIGDAFLDSPFLRGQFEFLWRKKKRAPAVMFLTLWLTRPAWSRML